MFCFLAGTSVATEHGLVPIENIKKSDKVWANDLRTGTWRLAEVITPLVHHYEGDVFTISVADDEIHATGDHPFWVIEDTALAGRQSPKHVKAHEVDASAPGRWVDAKDLRLDDVLLLRSGLPSRIKSVLSRRKCTHVYNLHVKDIHNYAVVKSGILVHNRKPDIQQIRDMALQEQLDPKKFGDFVEDQKQHMDGVDPRGQLKWQQLKELADLFKQFGGK